MTAGRAAAAAPLAAGPSPSCAARIAFAGSAPACGSLADRFSLVAGGLLHDHLPRTGPPYAPSVPEWTLLLGTVGLFAAALLLFARLLPVVSMYETRHEEDEAEVP
jgi:molybdopterin-containing oxidoreductase family membrane subunit